MGYSKVLTRKDFLRVTGAGAVGAALLGAAACGGSGVASGGKFAGTTLTVATVSNSQMEDMQSLTRHFTEKTGIKVRFAA